MTLPSLDRILRRSPARLPGDAVSGRFILRVSLIISAGILLLDLSIPLGVAGGVPYAAVVLLSLWSPRKRLTLEVAALATILTALGFVFSPSGGVLWQVVTNRLLAIGVIWVVALLTLQRKNAEEQIRESREQLRKLSRHLESIREQERTRIARELHDELGSALTSVKLDISWLKSEVTQDQTQVLFDEVTQKLDSTIQSMRRIATKLRPGILDAVGIVAAIEWQLEEFEKQTGIACNLELPEEDLALDKEQSTAIFRIIQETLTNIVRHADASELRVLITQTVALLSLEVIDNGKGTSDKQLSHKKSLGILGMRERILPWGGELLITANGEKEGGTTVRVTLPL